MLSTITHTTRSARKSSSTAPHSALSSSPLRTLRTALLSLLLAAAASAQDLAPKAPPQAKPILIINATIHPVTSTTLQSGWILFDRGVIQGIGMGPPAMKVSGAETIDAKGKHVYPGLFAANTQLGLAEIGAVRASNDFTETGEVTPEVRAASAINPDSTLIPVTRSNGVLTAAVFPEGGRIPGQVSVIRLDGWTWEDMAVKADAGVAVEWPNMRPVVATWMERSEQEQADDIRKSVAVIDDAFKNAKSYLAARGADPSQPIDLRWEALRGVFPAASADSSHPTSNIQHPTSTQLPVFVLAQDVDQITAAVTWSLQNGLKLVLVGGRDAPMVADLLKRHDIPVIITGTHAFPKRSDSPYDDAYTLPARLNAAGIKFAIASADRTAHERNLPYNAAMAVAYGLDRDAALKSVTLWPAEIFGLSRQLGSIETTRSATLIITDGDPLEVTTHIERAFIDGREIDLSNKQTRLAEKYREKYRQKESSAAASKSEPKERKGP
jgi:imidazolonepropionase-like amidohydrolase